MSLIESSSCDLVLYTNPRSRGQIARWMLEETGAAYRQVILDYDTTMKASEYLKINPMGKVPAIQHKGHVVTECAAICAYLADTFPEAGLSPALTDRASYYRWLFFAAGPLEAAVVNRTLKVNVSEQQQRMVGYGTFEKTIDVIAQAVTSNPYVAGSRFSAADVYVGSHIIWGMQFGTLPQRAEFQSYAEKLTSRKAYQNAKTIDEQLGKELEAKQGHA